MAYTLMVQGTTSDAGKSVLVAGLCRLFKRLELQVAPFKPQNMALNSAVTEDGGEIGRAQAVQAQACALKPHTDFNPVLLKPDTDTGAQVIIHGKALSTMEAESYHDYKKVAMQAVLESHKRLEQQFEMIVVEGAGSPAEINLREGDIANMGFAEEVDCPVIIIADIDRGGVFAHLVGTLALLSESEQQRVKGFVINRFRGDIKLLESGLKWLEETTGKPVLAVLPYLHDFYLEAEDGIDRRVLEQAQGDKLKVLVPIWPRISNHTDFDPLRLHPQVEFSYVRMGESLPAADLIILPGSKNVRSDLRFMKQQGWDEDLLKHLRYGGKVLGICGGYQMLGQYIDDPLGVEGEAGKEQGLCLLDVHTCLQAQKQLKQVSAQLNLNGLSAKVSAYEIHAGVSSGSGLDRPLIDLARSAELDASSHYADKDGAISPDNQVIGTYLHGLFDEPDACSVLLQWAGLKAAQGIDMHTLREQQLDRLADTLAEHMDMAQLYAVCQFDDLI